MLSEIYKQLSVLQGVDKFPYLANWDQDLRMTLEAQEWDRVGMGGVKILH